MSIRKCRVCKENRPCTFNYHSASTNDFIRRVCKECIAKDNNEAKEKLLKLEEEKKKPVVKVSVVEEKKEEVKLDSKEEKKEKKKEKKKDNPFLQKD